MDGHLQSWGEGVARAVEPSALVTNGLALDSCTEHELVAEDRGLVGERGSGLAPGSDVLRGQALSSLGSGGGGRRGVGHLVQEGVDKRPGSSQPEDQ